MKISVYCVKDSYLGFGMPVLRDNDSVASRAFEHDVKLDNSPYATRPDTYQLYHIAEYDSDTGIIDPVTVRFICSAADFIERSDS